MTQTSTGATAITPHHLAEPPDRVHRQDVKGRRHAGRRYAGDGRPTTVRAAQYIRMSTDDQADSPERQRSLVLPYCERKGYIVVEVYEDLGMRGWDDARPG